MKLDYHAMAMDLLNSGMGDNGRLRFILECIAKNKPLYKTDMIFLESASSQLELKIQRLQENTSRSIKPQEKHHHLRTTLISDEQLEKHIEKIIDEDNSKKTTTHNVIRKKSFLARLFSRWLISLIRIKDKYT